MSAVKALQIAQEQGQKIYTITKENYAQVLPKLRLSSTVMTDIRDAVNAGRVVTTHEKTIYYKGWKGGGYVIIDPHSGTGAYLIDGGANGAIILAIIGAIFLLVALVAFTGGLGPIILAGAAVSGGGAFFVGLTSLVLGVALYLSSLAKLLFIDKVKPSCSAGVAAIGVTLALLFAPKNSFKESLNSAGWLMTTIFGFLGYAKEVGYDINC